MARDYAQRSTSRRQTRNGGGLPAWVWAIVGLSAGLAVAAMVYVARPARDGAVTVAAPAAPHAPSDEKKKGAPVAIPPKEKERFTFYELLPNQEVIVPRDSVKIATPSEPGTAPKDAPGGTYVIQAASYKSRDDADKQKAQLALIGVESKVESVTIDGKETYYRVRIGPERDWNRVMLLMSRLEDNGVQAMLVKVK